MGWAKFDDQFTDHPKVVAAGPMAELLAMRAVIHCARYETDGHVQAAQLPRLALGVTSPKKQVAALVREGLWEEDPDGDGWWVHDFLDYHPSKTDKDEEREKARERMAKARANKPARSGGSSGDVRANTQENNGGSSGNPDPTPPEDQKHPPGGNDKPFVRRLANRLREDGCEFQGDWPTKHEAFQELLTQALERLDEAEHHNVAMGVIADFVQQVQGMPLTRESRSHTAGMIRNHSPTAVLYGYGQALDWGAGTTREYADDPLALSRYVAGVLNGKSKRGAA